VGLKLNGTHQLLAYTDDVNLLEDNTDIVKKNTETLIDASKKAGLEINVVKTKYMLFEYLGTTVTNQNLIQEEIKRRLNSGNGCYHSVQNLLSSRLLSKNVNIKMYMIIILLLVLYGCEISSLTLREEHRLSVFENRVLRRIFEKKGDEVTGEWRKLHNEDLHDVYSSPSIIRITKSRRMRWAGHVVRMGKKRNSYRFLVSKPEGKNH
jgi:hypothetical protein